MNTDAHVTPARSIWAVRWRNPHLRLGSFWSIVVCQGGLSWISRSFPQCTFEEVAHHRRHFFVMTNPQVTTCPESDKSCIPNLSSRIFGTGYVLIT